MIQACWCEFEGFRAAAELRVESSRLRLVRMKVTVRLSWISRFRESDGVAKGFQKIGKCTMMTLLC